MVVRSSLAGHFTLTLLLLDSLRAAAATSEGGGGGGGRRCNECVPSRIVHVSSLAHWDASLEMTEELKVGIPIAYFEGPKVSTQPPKPSNVRLQVELKKPPSDAVAAWYDPNYGRSKLAQLLFSNALNRRLRLDGANVQSVAVHPGLVRSSAAVDAIESPFWRRLIRSAGWVCGKNDAQGAQSTLHCVLCADDVGGRYFSDCREETRFVSAASGDVRLEEALFKSTMDLLRI